jgi:hypothetical protein
MVGISKGIQDKKTIPYEYYELLDQVKLKKRFQNMGSTYFERKRARYSI